MRVYPPLGISLISTTEKVWGGRGLSSQIRLFAANRWRIQVSRINVGIWPVILTQNSLRLGIYNWALKRFASFLLVIATVVYLEKTNMIVPCSGECNDICGVVACRQSLLRLKAKFP